jgi:hypothetical protein
MMLLHHKIVRAVLAGVLLTAALAARAQSATAIHGAAIDAAPTPPAVAPASSNVVVQMTDGVLNADFQTLASYNFTVPDIVLTNQLGITEAEKQIPAAIKQMDGKTVRIEGFMMPIRQEKDKTTEFLITRTQASCCYGGATAITELVTVKAPGEGFETMMDVPIIIQGKLHVGAVMDSGFIVGIYALDAEKLIVPEK